MELTHVRYEKTGHVATVTLDREDVRNAYSEAMIESLERAFDAATDDDDVRCVIVTGAGKAFSAGGDIKAMLDKSGMFAGEPAALREGYLSGIHRVPRRIARFEKPLIAAVNGPAIGAGLDLACMCDIRVATSQARFGSTFVKLGLVPGDGGAFFLSRVIGFPRALELMLTGRLIDAQEAERIGLVSRVVAPEQLREAAQETAELIAANGPVAVRLTKAACYQGQGLSPEQALSLAATYQGIAQNTSDHAEGVQALLDKRSPRFEGR